MKAGSVIRNSPAVAQLPKCNNWRP